MKHHLFILGFVTLAALGILSTLTSLKFKNHELPWKIIALYVGGSFLAQGVSMLFWTFEMNNLTVLHVYSLFQFIAFSAFFWTTTQRRAKRQSILIITVVISILLIINSIWNESLRDFNSLGVFVSNGTIVVYSVLYFFEVLGSDSYTKNHLIVNAGILLFMCESLVVFLFGNYLKEVKFIDQIGLWLTHAITYFLFLILIYWNHVKLARTR
ncbi:MAG: hypothetical protein HWE22_16130 [Flavobacteriales bacterium]|nr:hypothetical protein [Flavobacteriales bacterium]